MSYIKIYDYMINYGKLYIPIDRLLELYRDITYKQKWAYLIRGCRGKISYKHYSKTKRKTNDIWLYYEFW